MTTVDTLIEKVRNLPGITLDPEVVSEVLKQTDFTLVALHKYIATESGTDLEYNENGAPRFMPKDPKEVKREIRDLWERDAD